jgi:hypothetical protein
MWRKITLAAAGYSIVTFILGFTWHLVLFKDVYETFGVYNRTNPIIPLGFASMLIQGVVLAILYARQERRVKHRRFASAITFNLLIGAFSSSATYSGRPGKLEWKEDKNARRLSAPCGARRGCHWECEPDIQADVWRHSVSAQRQHALFRFAERAYGASRGESARSGSYIASR